MKTRTPAIGVLVSIILFVFSVVRWIILQHLFLESIIRLIAILFALRAGIDYRLYQAQFVRTLGTWRFHVMNQLFYFQW